MMEIRKRLPVRIIGIVIFVTLLFTNTVYPFSLKSCNILRLPLNVIDERRTHEAESKVKEAKDSMKLENTSLIDSIIPYLERNCMFSNEGEVPSWGYGELTDVASKYCSKIPVGECFLYRGMRLTIEGLKRIICSGLEVERTRWKEDIRFTDILPHAVEFSFRPGNLDGTMPVKDFLSVIGVVKIHEIHGVERKGDDYIVSKDVSPEEFEVFVFNWDKETYIDTADINENSMLGSLRKLLANIVRFARSTL